MMIADPDDIEHAELDDVPGVIEDHEFLETVDDTNPDYFQC